MNRLALLLFALLAAAGAHAQDAAQGAGERTRIAQERSRVEAEFAARQKACYGKFAVNDCIEEANAVRREALADLRRQEIALNDQERRRRAAERQRELEDKAAEQSRRQAQPRAPAARDRTPAPAGKPRGEPAAPEPARAKAEARPPRAAKERELPDVEENLRRDQERQAQARERREKVERRNAEKPQKAAPLPVPP